MFRFNQVTSVQRTNPGQFQGGPALAGQQPGFNTTPGGGRAQGGVVAKNDQVDRIKRAASATTQAPNLGLRDSIQLPANEQNPWAGINTALAPEMLSPDETPFALNIRGDVRPGTLSTRLGLAACDARGKATEAGLSIHDLQLTDSSDESLMLIATDDGGGNVTLTVDAQTLSVVPDGDMPFSPSVTLTGGSGTIRCQVVEPIIGERSKVVMRWHSDGYPESIYPLADYLSDTGQEWEWAASGDFDSTKSGITAGDYFVTVWIASRSGWSLPYYEKVTVS